MLQICSSMFITFRSTHTYFILNFYNGIFTNWHGMIMAFSDGFSDVFSDGSWKIWMHLPMSGDVLSNAESPRGKRERGFCYCHFRKANALKSLYIAISNVIYNSFVGVVAYLGSVVLSFLSFSLCNFTRNSAWARCIGASFCAANERTENWAQFSSQRPRPSFWLLIFFCNTY